MTDFLVEPLSTNGFLSRSIKRPKLLKLRPSDFLTITFSKVIFENQSD